MKPTRLFKGLRLVVKPVSHNKTMIMLSYVKDKRLWPSGVRPIGSECLAYVDGYPDPVMSGFAAANTQCEADQRVRFYTKQHLNKRMKKHKPVIRSTVEGEYHATVYHGGAYHYGYGVTIEAAVENAKYNIKNFSKILDEIIEPPNRFERAGVQVIAKSEPSKPWWQFWK